MKKGKIIIYTLFFTALIMFYGAIYVQAAEKATAPVAENLELTTFRDVSLEGQLKATSPSGLSLCFEITTPPSKGTVKLSDNGSFVYTPKDGKKGRDYFGYKAFDSNNNCSSEATVIISIKKQKALVTYSDMHSNGAEYAASELAEKGVFVGECVGGNYVFSPNAPVSRSEFLTMCMKLTNLEVLSGVITTGFADDEAIDPYLKPYVSTALLTGIISGYSNGRDTAVFNGDSYISYPEAAVMLNKALNITDVNVTDGVKGVPVWAAQACANLTACRIYDYSMGAEEQNLSRADSAKLLLGAMKVLEKR